MSNILVAIERKIYWTWTFYIGARCIGQAVARRALGFGMSILYMDQYHATRFRGRNRRPASEDGRIAASGGIVDEEALSVPHLGSATPHSRAANGASRAARNVVLAGYPPITPVPR